MSAFCSHSCSLRMLSSQMFRFSCVFQSYFVMHPFLIIQCFVEHNRCINFDAFCISSCFRLPKLHCFFLILSTNLCRQVVAFNNFVCDEYRNSSISNGVSISQFSCDFFAFLKTTTSGSLIFSLCSFSKAIYEKFHVGHD